MNAVNKIQKNPIILLYTVGVLMDNEAL